MDERSVWALLTLMNLSAPVGTQWCAWQPDAGYLAEDYKIRDQWRFYLVEDGSELNAPEVTHLVWGSR